MHRRGHRAGRRRHRAQAAVLREVLAVHAAATEPLDVLAALGGFEVATLVGVVLQAAQERRVIVVDGFIASAAVLVASRCAACAAALRVCPPLGRARPRRHAGAPGRQPLLDLGLRLGEGSGAALAWPLLQSACAILREMASFDSAGVSQKA
jgi:nicotinate-nucleotide--dimethylbenzimidazole phosphoribosyltransferase